MQRTILDLRLHIYVADKIKGFKRKAILIIPGGVLVVQLYNKAEDGVLISKVMLLYIPIVSSARLKSVN